jgi:futalosine hydrolase
MPDDFILVLAAVMPEIQGLLDRIGNPSDRRIGGRQVWCGRMHGMPIRIVVTGPGIINTVQSITACMENARPSLMLQAGCGGGFRQHGMRIGDIAVATAEVDVHLGIETGKHNKPLLEMPFPLLEIDGKALKEKYSLDMNMAETAFLRLKTVYEPQGVSVFKGSFITGSTVTGSEERAAFLFKTYSPCMESMEGAGAAFLSHYYQVPFLEIRCASNMVGKRELSKWDLPLACDRAGQAAADMVEFFVKEQHDLPVISGLFHLPQ